MVAAVGLLIAVIMTAPRDFSSGEMVSDATVIAMTRQHCAMCHAAVPTHESFEEAPKGIQLETIEELHRYADLIMQQAVQADTMPLGNETGMTVEERATFGAWITQQK